MTGQDFKSGSTKTVGQLVSFRLTFARVAAPASRIVPFVASACCIHVDGDQTNVPAAQLGANAVDSFGALFNIKNAPQVSERHNQWCWEVLF